MKKSLHNIFKKYFATVDSGVEEKEPIGEIVVKSAKTGMRETATMPRFTRGLSLDGCKRLSA